MTNIDTGTYVLRTRGLRREYGREASLVRPVDWWTWDRAGETVAIISPSRCGMSTCCTCRRP